MNICNSKEGVSKAIILQLKSFYFIFFFHFRKFDEGIFAVGLFAIPFYYLLKINKKKLPQEISFFNCISSVISMHDLIFTNVKLSIQSSILFIYNLYENSFTKDSMIQWSMICYPKISSSTILSLWTKSFRLKLFFLSSMNVLRLFTLKKVFQETKENIFEIK